jgi:hypothetical protein
MNRGLSSDMIKSRQPVAVRFPLSGWHARAVRDCFGDGHSLSTPRRPLDQIEVGIGQNAYIADFCALVVKAPCHHKRPQNIPCQHDQGNRVPPGSTQRHGYGQHCFGSRPPGYVPFCSTSQLQDHIVVLRAENIAIKLLILLNTRALFEFMQRRLRWCSRLLFVISLVLGLIGSASCTERQPSTAGLPVVPSPLSIPEPSVPGDVQRVNINITDGHFESDIYTTQAGPSRLWVTTDGRAYTFGIDALVASRELPANATTQIGLTAPEPARFTMRLSGGGTEFTATLDVRPVGGR